MPGVLVVAQGVDVCWEVSGWAQELQVLGGLVGDDTPIYSVE